MPKQYLHVLFFSWSVKLNFDNERGKICWENESRINFQISKVIVLKTTSQKINGILKRDNYD